MKKTYFFLTICCCYLISCSQPSIADKRKNTMMEIVNAVIKNDTTKLFILVDTSIIFNTTGRDEFMYNVNSLSTIFFKEKMNINKDDFLPIDFYNGAEAYQIEIPLKKSIFNKIELEFSFYHGVYNFVYSFDAYFRKKEIEPLETAPYN